MLLPCVTVGEAVEVPVATGALAAVVDGAALGLTVPAVGLGAGP
ncbi:hypothetical protein [Actinacidiphila acididurans]|nr:hypothetical protein [Actinacidiphila acididurans]